MTMQEIESILDAHLLNESQKGNREQYEKQKQHIKKALNSIESKSLNSNYQIYYNTLKNIYSF